MWSLEMYLKIGDPNVNNEPEAIWEDLKYAQSEMPSQLRAVNEILAPRENTNQERVFWGKHKKHYTPTNRIHDQGS